MLYYKLVDDLHTIKGRWFLGELNLDNPFDFWNYVRVNRVPKALADKRKLEISVRKKGHPLDFTFADFDVPVINSAVLSLIRSDSVDVIPVELNGVIKQLTYYVLLLKVEVECIDETLSEFLKFDNHDLVRPDKVGSYRAFQKMIINPDLVNGLDIFRVKGFNSAIIISESLRKQFLDKNVSGVRFLPVVGY